MAFGVASFAVGHPSSARRDDLASGEQAPSRTMPRRRDDARLARAPERTRRCAILSVTAIASVGIALQAHAQTAAPPSTVPLAASSTPSASAAAFDFGPAGSDTNLRQGLDPLPSRGIYLSYGVTLSSESMLSAGGVCPSAKDCVIGPGGGIGFSGAYRMPTWTLGATYEVSFHDSNSIYQRGVLQHLRGDARWRPRWGMLFDKVSLFGGFGAGIGGYGDNWAIAAFGPSLQLALGAELEAAAKLAIVFSFSYRALYLQSFPDPNPQYPNGGVVQFLGLTIGVELNDPL